MSNLVTKVTNKFKKLNLTESIEIQLDNLDWAKLVLNSHNKVMVENEHGTLFDLDHLTNIELEIFYKNLDK